MGWTLYPVTVGDLLVLNGLAEAVCALPLREQQCPPCPLCLGHLSTPGWAWLQECWAGGAECSVLGTIRSSCSLHWALTARGSPASFLTLPSNIPSSHPRPSTPQATLFDHSSFHQHLTKTLLQKQCLKQTVLRISKALPEGVICCKKIRKPVTSDLHTWAEIVLVLWHWQGRREAVRMKARLC